MNCTKNNNRVRGKNGIDFSDLLTANASTGVEIRACIDEIVVRDSCAKRMGSTGLIMEYAVSVLL